MKPDPPPQPAGPEAPALTVSLEPPDQPEVVTLIAALDAYQDSLYPAEARYALDLASLSLPHVLFAVVRRPAGTAVGCAAVVLHPGYGELKRMYVQPDARRTGTASLLIGRLEAEASARGCPRLMLETGPFQPEALAFYGRHGYARCGPFGDYPAHDLSVFMSKQLEPPSPRPGDAGALIDARIGELQDWRGALLARLRALIRSADPQVAEEWKWNVPVWSCHGILCTGETYKKVVKLTFAKGASLPDPARLFNSSLDGKVRRAIDFAEGATVDADALVALVRAAIAQNRSGPARAAPGRR